MSAPNGARLHISRESALWKWGRFVVPIVALLVAVWLPTYFEEFRVNQFSRVLVFFVAAMSLNLLTGYNGQISLGHSAFFGLGAYTSAVLSADHGWPLLATIAPSLVIAFAVGMLCGVPALRIKGTYLALVTLALGTVFPVLVKRFDSVTGGSRGIKAPKLRAPEATGLADDQYRYYVVLVLAIIVFVISANLVRSRIGRALVAIRDNEIAAEVAGVNVAQTKVLIFGLSASMAALAGSMSICIDNFASPDSYTVIRSIEYLAGITIGGAASLLGPLIGGIYMTFAPEIFQARPALSTVFYGLALIILMYVMPTVLVGLVRRLLSRVVQLDPPALDAGALATSPGTSARSVREDPTSVDSPTTSVLTKESE
jgi:branched-chain amino acid transport system permease protein